MQEKKRSAFNRWVDFSSVALISVATVLTAWCSYEAARWTAIETRQYGEANANRISASVASSHSDALKLVDVAMFLRYVATVSENRPAEKTFIYRRFRPEMKRALDAWLATKPLANANAPSSPFAMRQYQVAADADVARLNAKASTSFESAQIANDQADSYVRLTVIFAAVSFLAGISTKMIFPSHIIIVVVGYAMLFFGLIRGFGYPIR